MKVWVDIDNAPHVLLFRPVIKRLTEQGADVEVTARDRSYVLELLRAAGISCTVIGRGQPRGAAAKATALARRSWGLARHASKRGFHVAVGHGSRSLPVAARAIGVPNLTMYDYEHVSTGLFRLLCDRILIPRAVATRMDGGRPGHLWVPYEGLKEDLYLTGFAPDPGVRASLGVGDDEILAVIRPPSVTAHYHDPGSEATLKVLLERASAMPGVRLVWLRREPGDPLPRAARSDRVIAPERPVDGPSLLATADLAISGGGTMIREAAVLGTPAYSIFTGPLGAVDEELIRAGRLTAVRDVGEIARIRFERKRPGPDVPRREGLCEFVVDQILELAGHRRSR